MNALSIPLTCRKLLTLALLIAPRTRQTTDSPRESNSYGLLEEQQDLAKFEHGFSKEPDAEENHEAGLF